MPNNPREKCKGCPLYKVLNPRHIVDGKPYKSCSAGEVPETCGEDTNIPIGGH